MLFAITPEERKRCGAAWSGHFSQANRLGDYFSDPSWNHSARLRSHISGINGMFAESAGLDDVAQNPES